TEDPLLVSAILRNKTMDWVRRSPSDSSWGDTMPLRWGGIFYVSGVPGGRLCRQHYTRLAGLITLCVEASGAVAFLRAGVTGLFRCSAMMAKMVQFGLSSKRPRHVQQVAQAYLDDLAANRCVGKQPVPLERLSEVARRTGSAEVNIPLVELFSQEGTGSLIVLDPRFHPGMDPVTVGLADASVRRAFLAVHWKGRPSGLALLGQLLSAGTLVPEFDTDADYLEAELEHLGQGHAVHRSKDGQWKLAHGWTVVREVADGNARTY